MTSDRLLHRAKLRFEWLWRRLTHPRESARLLVPRFVPLKLRMRLVPRLRRLVDRRQGLARGISAAPDLAGFVLDPASTPPTRPAAVAVGLNDGQLERLGALAARGWSVVEAPGASADALRRLRRERHLRQGVMVAGNGSSEAAAALAPVGWRWLDAERLPDDTAAADAALRRLYPLVSIVMVTHGNRACTQLGVESLLRHTTYPRFEVVVVDNASTDGTRDMLRGLAERGALRLVENRRNEGFAAASNRGVEAAAGELLCLLNNDTVVTPGWLDALVTAVADRGVGLAGPVSNAVANEARVDATYDDLPGMLRWAEAYTWRHDGQRFTVPLTTLFCGLVRREVWDEVGPLDEGFGVGLFEDHDYSRRLRAAGYDLLVCRDSFVHHWHHATFSRLQLETYCDLYERNRLYYKSKWRQATRRQRSELESAGA